MPRAIYFHDRFPYWNAFFRALDFGVRATPETNRAIAVAGVEASVAEPCFPIQIAHGQIANALEIDADGLRLAAELHQLRGDPPRDPELLLPVGDDAALHRPERRSRSRSTPTGSSTR